jgi:hypothetical protein
VASLVPLVPTTITVIIICIHAKLHGHGLLMLLLQLGVPLLLLQLGVPLLLLRRLRRLRLSSLALQQQLLLLLLLLRYLHGGRCVQAQLLLLT